MKKLLTSFAPRNCWRKFYKGKRYYQPFPITEEGYELAVQHWFKQKAKVDADLAERGFEPKQLRGRMMPIKELDSTMKAKLTPEHVDDFLEGWQAEIDKI